MATPHLHTTLAVAEVPLPGCGGQGIEIAVDPVSGQRNCVLARVVDRRCLRRTAVTGWTTLANSRSRKRGADDVMLALASWKPSASSIVADQNAVAAYRR